MLRKLVIFGILGILGLAASGCTLFIQEYQPVPVYYYPVYTSHCHCW